MYNLSSNIRTFNYHFSAETDAQKCIKDIINLLLDNGYDNAKINNILLLYHIEEIKVLKPYIMDYLLSFANTILQDNLITEEELYDFTVLKKIFKIYEGEFITCKSLAVREILQQQFLRLYADHYINETEALESVKLQSLFDLSYDAFEELKRDEIIAALHMGANPEDLDISSLPKGFKL
ncbi:hypothetical protein [Elizabethkingia meningoseptica]|uniref:hypothetical protein n=1 Tax=Elizabethkingia meningoseptica TaxID=238 RepID=UPI002DD688A9|nr:hypothetical protein [Elizabethkingia meningoseptica]MEC4711122.1 hypothetical protein [Elizabethkingia meningoseptica]